MRKMLVPTMLLTTLASVVGAQPSPETVYAPPTPPQPDDGYNAGAVHLSLMIDYATDYVFRGVELFDPPDAEDSLNLQVDARLSFDLGKAPHPYIGVFVNIADSDPVSDFQVVQPTIGFEWDLKPIKFIGGFNAFIYPDRSDLDTSEFFAGLEFDDSFLWPNRKPVFTPFVYAAYDVDLYDGIYLLAGVKHVMPIENTGLTLTFLGQAAYVMDHPLFAADPLGERDTGFQHYQVGVVGRFELNELLNIPLRYGRWSVRGYVHYTDGIDNDLRATTQLWGGGGIEFSY